jgi:hypothetical protein
VLTLFAYAHAARQKPKLHVLAERGLGQSLTNGREHLNDLLNAHPVGMVSLDLIEVSVLCQLSHALPRS